MNGKAKIRSTLPLQSGSSVANYTIALLLLFVWTIRLLILIFICICDENAEGTRTAWRIQAQQLCAARTKLNALRKCVVFI